MFGSQTTRFFFIPLSLTFLFAGVVSAAPKVVISSPPNNSAQNSKVHFIASASSAQCSRGISQMRVYPQEHVAAVSVNSAKLDTNVTLSPGSYSVVVQAWDVCGNSGSAIVMITVANPNLVPAKFLFAAQPSSNHIIGFRVNSSTGALTPTAQGAVATGRNPIFLASDNDGFRLYAANQDSQTLSAYFIYRNDGFLHPVPGSPVAVSGTPNYVAVHPSGKFVYVSAAQENGGGKITALSVHSDGSLHSIPGSPYSTVHPLSTVVVDPNGEYLYASSSEAADEYQDEYRIDRSTGELTPLPGEPHDVRLPNQYDCNDLCGGGTNEMTSDIGGKFLFAPLFGSGSIAVFDISHSTGQLMDARKSPFIDQLPNSPTSPGASPTSVAVDANGRFVYTNGCICGEDFFSTYIQQWQLFSSSGTLVKANRFFDPTVCEEKSLRADSSGKFLYALAEIACDPDSGIPTSNSLPTILVFSTANGNISMTSGSPFIQKAGAQFSSIAVTR
ncbi:MAG TPA: beta-propeller fold lactonase family protein [Terriglobales bacterium]|jgi:6-phosphogluconolactonase (cycloisomerase 2 family)